MTDDKTEDKVLNIDEMTVGQMEFICDYTNRTLADFVEALGSSKMTARDVIAVLAVIENPADPESALPAVRNMKVANIDISGLKN